MKIKRMKLPEKSLLFPDHEKYDYIDSFGGVFSDKENKIGIDEIAKDFMKPMPGWIDALMSLRNAIVSVVGLKRSNDKKLGKQPKDVRFVAGEKVGFFNVYSLTTNELVLGEDDKHLNFRISLFLGNQEGNPTKKVVAVTTVVTFNNWLGHAYFFFVKPFHQLIVPAMLAKDFKELASSE